MALTIKKDIKQITGYDVKDYTPVTLRSIKIPHRKNIPNEEGKYEIEFIDAEIPYVDALKNLEIIKLGYCCEDRGIIYPIFIKNKNSGDFDEIQICKNYIYEAQIEDDDDKEYRIAITDVQVPLGINFTLDYMIEEII